MKGGGGITGGASSAVTPFMLHNLTKSLSESTERRKQGEPARSSGGRQRLKQQSEAEAEAAVAREKERERVRLVREQRVAAERERRDGVVVCKERSGGVEWKYVSLDGRKRRGEQAMQVMHAKQHRDPVAVGLLGYSILGRNGIAIFSSCQNLI